MVALQLEYPSQIEKFKKNLILFVWLLYVYKIWKMFAKFSYLYSISLTNALVTD